MQPIDSNQPGFLRLFHRYGTAAFLLLGLLLAVVIRLTLFNFVSADYIFSFGRWYDLAVKAGPWKFIGLEKGTDYNAPYLYLLALGTLLPLKGLHVIKLISFLFDFGAAWVIFRLARMRCAGWEWPSLVTVLFLFAPTVVINGSLWGQCDSMPACLVLLSLALLLRERMTYAGVAYGLALAFKLQAVFFAPVLLILMLQGRFRLRDVGAGVATYLVSLLPALLAGRSVWNTLTIYLRQAGFYKHLTLDAANIYVWVGDSRAIYFALKPAGLCLTLLITMFSIYAILRSGVRLVDGMLISVALYFSILLPFFLPGMHERYFFLADVLAIVYAMYYPRRWWVPLAMGVMSYAMYSRFLFNLVVIPLVPLSLLVGGLLIYVGWQLCRELFPAGWPAQPADQAARSRSSGSSTR